MKKHLPILCLLPIVLTSCANASYVSLDTLKAHIDGIVDNDEHPIYRVQANLVFNDSLTHFDEIFDQNPEGDKYVPYARYHKGFYCAKAGDSAAEDERNVVIFGMASRSHWLRAPLRITKDNFYKNSVEFDFDDNPIDTGEENPTCAHYQIEHMITFWMDQDGSNNPSSCKAYYEILPDGGFAIGGNAVHTWLRIDNYPAYADPSRNPYLFITQEEWNEMKEDDPDYWPEWSKDDPRPAYKSQIDAKMNIRFEYDKDGWLKREYAASLGYNDNIDSDAQFFLESVYTYQFN